MKIRILFLFLVLSLSASAIGGVESRIRVLIIEGYGNHDWRYITEVIYSMLVSTNMFTVDITSAPELNSPEYDKWDPQFNKYDVLVQNTNSLGNGNRWPESVQKKFEKYMKRGGGMYVFHSANNAFSEWEAYNDMIGLGWRSPDEGVAIEIVDGEIVRIPVGEGKKTHHGPRVDIQVEKFSEHPINEAYPEVWKSPDTELYKYARGPAENIQILSVTMDSVTGRKWPVDWVVRYGSGRIYNSTFGHIWHDVRMPAGIQCIGFQTNFIRAMQWLAGKDITWSVPDNFPAKEAYSMHPVEIIHPPEHGWKQLFDGHSLDAWSVQCLPADKEKNFWFAKEGYIECNSIGHSDHDYVWLVNDEEFEDFQLLLQFQVFKTSRGNSGVQFRSRFDDSELARKGGWLDGPQSDIHPPNPLRAGLIYDETDGVNRWIFPSLPDYNMVAEQAPKSAHQTKFVYVEDNPDAWNTMEIICEGMHIETFVNGIRITDFDAEGILNDALHLEKNVGTKGKIALQLHSRDELLIRFREIIIREID